MAVLMVFPQRMADVMNIEVESAPSFNYGVRYGVPLMVGWTILLFWVDRKPLERKDVLLITLFPVVSGYILFELYSVAAGYATIEMLIPQLVMQTTMSSLFIFSFWNAQRGNCRP
jgi:hypothetical protein